MARRKSYYGSFLSQFICPDIDVTNFITAHETATGETMEDIQRAAICGFVARLKGTGTTNGSNLWSSMVSRGARLFPLCPISDIKGNALAYQMDLISASSLGTYNNFIAGDFLPTGVKAISPTGKYFDSGALMSSYDFNDVSIGLYNRDNRLSTTVYAAGTYDGTVSTDIALRQSSSVSIGYGVNDSISLRNVNSLNNDGLIITNRTSTSSINVSRNNITIDTFASTRFAPSAIYNLYFHALNNIGSAAVSSDYELSMYIVGSKSFTSDELTDFNESVQWYQQNVITGGRDV
jgi:hypothetical protein